MRGRDTPTWLSLKNFVAYHTALSKNFILSTFTKKMSGGYFRVGVAGKLRKGKKLYIHMCVCVLSTHLRKIPLSNLPIIIFSSNKQSSQTKPTSAKPWGCGPFAGLGLHCTWRHLAVGWFVPWWWYISTPYIPPTSASESLAITAERH